MAAGPCDVVELARDALATWLGEREGADVALRLETPEGPLPWLLVDEIRLSRLLEDLLGHGLDVTRRGPATLALSYDDVRHRLHLDLSDPTAGPTLRRSMVASLDDTLSPEGLEAQGAPVPGRVLFLDTRAIHRQILGAQLQGLGYDATAVGDGDAAIDAFVPGVFELVLLDGDLAGGASFDVAGALRRKELTHDVRPVRLIAVSASVEAAHVARCMACGFDAVLGKPLTFDILRAAMASHARSEMLALFRNEAVVDLEGIRLAFARGDTPRAERYVHRLGGAAMVCGLDAVVAHVDALGALLRTTAPTAAAIDAGIACIHEVL